MIIQIRGTSGSGKSTVMTKVMEQVGGGWQAVYVEGRKRPLYYRAHEHPFVVLGHYEIPCGGCDTIGSAPEVFKVLMTLPMLHVLTEGLLWSEDVKWTLLLKDVRALFLVTPLNTCLNWVTTRQDGRKPLDPDRVRRKLSTRIGTIDRARLRLIEAGVNCRRCSADQAPGIILDLLRESCQS